MTTTDRQLTPDQLEKRGLPRNFYDLGIVAQRELNVDAENPLDLNILPAGSVVRCSVCGAELPTKRDGVLQHGDDGSHMFVPAGDGEPQHVPVV